MLYEEKIYEGLSIELVVQEGEYQGRYRTRIEEVGKRILSIGVPIVHGQFIPLREGTNLEITFADEITAYSFSTTIIKRISMPIPTFIMEYPAKIHKIQRRQYVRVQVFRPCGYRTLENEGISDEKKGFMNDLSGGGMLFKTDERIPSQSLVLLKIPIGKDEIEIPGIVIRSVREEDKDSYLVSIQFHEISEKIRDKIIGFVFDLQREMRKKGLM